VLVLPDHPALDELQEQARSRRRERGIPLGHAEQELARDYGFAGWPDLVRRVQGSALDGVERALVLADPAALTPLLAADQGAATAPTGGLVPLLVLLRRSLGRPDEVRACAGLLLAAGADPDSHTVESGGEWRRTALFDAVERRDLALVRLLLDHGATPDEDAFYHACEQSEPGYLDALYAPGFEGLVRHKLDFEDAAGLRWFLDHGVDVDAQRCLHWAVGRGRGVAILQLLLDAGADVNLPVGVGAHAARRPLALAARCGHLAAYELLAAHGATAELDPVDAAVLAVARGQSTRLPDVPPPVLGVPHADGRAWILGQFAQHGRTAVVRALLDAGQGVDARGWSNFTPLDQAAMHGRADTAALLVDRGADLNDCAFDEYGPTPLDCAVWGWHNNRAADGDYRGTVEVLVAAGAPTRHEPPTGDPAIDALLGTRSRRPRSAEP
jgi:ankyrin repeat protein